jgi:hypothetical protein
MNYKGMAAGKDFAYLFSNMERQGHTDCVKLPLFTSKQTCGNLSAV